MEDSIAYDIASKGCSVEEHRQAGNIQCMANCPKRKKIE